MSYKVDLSDLQREGDVSLTQQLVDRFVAAIESGELEPGEKLPPTRALAAEAASTTSPPRACTGAWPSSATSRPPSGRGTFVRTLVPAAAAEEQGDDWQVCALPDRAGRPTPSRSWPTPSASRASPGMISLADRLALAAAATRPRSSPQITAEVFARGGRRRARLPHGRGALRAARAARAARARGFATDADEIIVTSGARQAIDLVGARAARAGRRGGGRVADVRRHARVAARHGRARDRRARRRATGSTSTRSSACSPATR